MTEKPLPSPEQMVYHLINITMDKYGGNAIARIVFEQSYAKEGYKIDWNKRLDSNGEWKDKKELER